MPLINSETELELSWSKECILSKISRTVTVAVNLPNPARKARETNNAIFQINNAKLYVFVVTLFINNNIKFF